MKPEQTFPLQGSIAVVLTIRGPWHAAGPRIFGHSARHAAVISDGASGLTLAAVGIGILVLNGGTWLNWIAAGIGVWVLISPQLLGNAGPRMVMLEATWGGPLTIVLAVLAALERQFDRI